MLDPDKCYDKKKVEQSELGSTNLGPGGQVSLTEKVRQLATHIGRESVPGRRNSQCKILRSKFSSLEYHVENR